MTVPDAPVDDASTYDCTPLSKAELSLAEIADWGTAENWSDWADAPR